MTIDDWYGYYREGWGDSLIQEAYSHPAKVNPGLSRHIYDHCFEMGWLKEGSVVLDPFAGIGGFALQAILHGCDFFGCELEQRFVDLAQQNIALWKRQYAGWPKLGSVVIIQGDSRRLVAVLDDYIDGIDIAISSPPYADQTITSARCFKNRFNDMPLAKDAVTQENIGYSADDANLCNLQDGGVDGVISSPPYEASLSTERSGIDWSKVNQGDGKIRDFTSEPYQKYRPGAGGEMRYGQSEGQLGQMCGGFDGAISSPPYGASFHGEQEEPDKTREKMRQRGLPESSIRKVGDGSHTGGLGYGNTEGQLSNEVSDTFWSAAKTIIEQCYQVLKPGAVAIWTLKAFVRNGRVVDFPDQWRQLCEHCGFETLHIHRAWLVEEQGTQYDLFGGKVERRRKKTSFFRRLYEKRHPENAIDYEVVLCTRKC